MEYGILMICYSAGGQYHWVAGKSYHTIFAEFITDVQQLVSIISIGRLYNSNRIVSWERWMPILSWITGWANVSGWVSDTRLDYYLKIWLMVQVALVATGGLLGSELVLGVISLMHPVCHSPIHA